MYKIVFADKDAYVTNRKIGTVGSGTLKTKSNTGRAGTLDIFKLYGATIASGGVPNLELSRAFIHFDMQPIKDMMSEGKININHSSFNCRMKLFDVYGGQTTPSNFHMSIFPLSRSFAEGEGRDVVYYSDYDVCNFLSSSYSEGEWFLSGCGFPGYPEQSCDYITGSSNLGSLEVKQLFSTGEEDLDVDVTKIVSATLAGMLPDSGFRMTLSKSYEDDKFTYFVKRFSSRSAYNSSKHPRLIFKYDDSLQDDTQLLRFDSPATLFLRNYEQDSLSNLLSGSSLTPVSGFNCLLLKMMLTRSDGSGSYSLYFTGSQHHDGLNFYPGIYSATFVLPQSDTIIKNELQKSGSIKFTPVWGSIDDTVGYFTGSEVYVYPPQRSDVVKNANNYVVTVTGLQSLHRSNEQAFLKLNIFDYASPYIRLVKTPAELPGIVIKNAHYQVRDYATNEIIVPFDDVHNSTKISSDVSGMYFTLDISNLPKERSYVIDVMLKIGGIKNIFKSVSPVFNVSDIQTS